MADIRRLIWLLVGVMLAAVPMLAFAEGGTVFTATGRTWTACIPPVTATGSTKHAACAAVWAAQGQGTCWSSDPAPTLNQTQPGDNFCTFLNPFSWNNTVFSDVDEGVPVTCQAGEVWNSSTAQCEAPPAPVCDSTQWLSGLTNTCECRVGYNQNPDGTCSSQCEARGEAWGWYSTNNAGSSCSAGCLLSRSNPSKSSACVETAHDANGQPTAWSCQMGYTGSNCTYAEPAPGEEPPTVEPPAAPEICAEGSYSGTVNGVAVCIAAPPPTDVVSNETTTTGPITTTKEKTEVCTGGTCEIVTTTTTHDSSTSQTTVTTTTTQQGQGGFCEENPTSRMCGEEQSEWAADCAAPPLCKGDAIQCAIAKTLHEQKCLAEEEKAEAQVFLDAQGTGVIDQAKVAQALNADGAHDIDVAQGFLDAQATYVAFASECLPPLFFEFKGTRYDFDVAFICGIGDFVRLMMHIAAYMAVLTIVGRGFAS